MRLAIALWILAAIIIILVIWDLIRQKSDQEDDVFDLSQSEDEQPSDPLQ